MAAILLAAAAAGSTVLGVAARSVQAGMRSLRAALRRARRGGGLRGAPAQPRRSIPERELQRGGAADGSGRV
jgi:hypothetical protein